MKEKYLAFIADISPEKSDKELLAAVLDKAQKKEKIKTTERKKLKRRL